jgi:hypothetical protein
MVKPKPWRNCKELCEEEEDIYLLLRQNEEHLRSPFGTRRNQISIQIYGPKIYIYTHTSHRVS